MDEEALVSVVHGNPSTEELAALVVALTSLSVNKDSRPSGSAPPMWTRSGRPPHPAATWRESGLPS
ncbi:acyl-CoA carboxylase subunit epsilon [Actinoplanes sp. NPDC051494]|uniref:acyl-CoA carboxylase subunit epsilon n=1 Tax=Actinoplanes sp. NPDC051494 TaxID=3363907 RepID=UPI0037952CC7